MSTLTDDRTLTDRALAASADRVVHAARRMGRPHVADPDLAVAWQAERGVFTNMALVLAEPDSWEEVLGRVDQVVPADRPVSLVAATAVPDLTSRGWVLVGHPPLMVRPPGGAGPEVPSELTIEGVYGDRSLGEFEQALAQHFPEPGLLPYRWGSLHDGRVLGGPTQFLIGRVAGRAVATASSHVAEGVNLVEMVTTDPAVRGRGYGAALTASAMTADPDLPAALIASDLGRGVYERLGFIAVSRWTFWHRPV
ncbi:GNAT family N-acetyltransferase [Aquihabitans sp. McL0605]|uniref:GNAT family N-acetyltransferase n=1 Tax=Aquihabitans sp. McL0605 TaxID=3415671 RepID=UPI003CF82742